MTDILNIDAYFSQYFLRGLNKGKELQKDTPFALLGCVQVVPLRVIYNDRWHFLDRQFADGLRPEILIGNQFDSFDSQGGERRDAADSAEINRSIFFDSFNHFRRAVSFADHA